MSKDIDILAYRRWKSAYIENQVAKIEATLSKIEQNDTLTPDNWKEIVDLSDDLLEQARNLQEFATDEYQRAIGD